MPLVLKKQKIYLEEKIFQESLKEKERKLQQVRKIETQIGIYCKAVEFDNSFPILTKVKERSRL